MGIFEDISIRSRTHFSIQHIQSASLFARNALEIEKNPLIGSKLDEIFSRHRAYVIGSVVSSVSFLEAAINELYLDISDKLDGPRSLLGAETADLIAGVWKLGVDSLSTLRKYQIALMLAQKETFLANALPYQDVELLIQLRNNLVHYEPQWIKLPSSTDFTTEDIHKMGKKLNGKFAENPLAGKGNAFYPDKCLGYGCADWAVRSSLIFADDFFSRMGLSPPYDHVKDRLDPK